jgi:hypothetical protein
MLFMRGFIGVLVQSGRFVYLVFLDLGLKSGSTIGSKLGDELR